MKNFFGGQKSFDEHSEVASVMLYFEQQTIDEDY